MSAFPPGRESKARYCPSGDQRGVPVSAPRKDVSARGCAPELSQTQISSLPDRSDRNAILLPSGEYCALVSCLVEKMSFSGRWTGSPAEGNSMRQIFESDESLE